MERTIKINLDFARFELAENYQDLRKAIGYFACYGVNTYDHISIYHDGKGLDLYAVFSRSSDNRQMVIGAIWDSEKRSYSFHS